jgi:hypothetical protein
MKTPAQPPAKPAQPSLGCLLLLNLVGISLIGGFLWARAGREKAQVEAALANPAATFTADQLCQAYENNPLPFEDGKGKVAVVVSGPINRIDVDSSGAITVAIGGGLLGGVGCTFEPDQKEAIAKLGKGKKITAKGVMGGRDFTGQVQLTRCRLMPQEGK